VLVKATPSVGPPAFFLLAPGRHLTVDVRGGDGGRGGDGKVEASGTGIAWGRGGGLITQRSTFEFSGGLGGDGRQRRGA
jgi:hypothetical protein